MTLRQFPECCGMGILHGLSNWPRQMYGQRVASRREAISNYMTRAKRRNFGRILAITADRYQQDVIADLEALGWTRADTYRNPNSSNIVSVWVCDLIEKKDEVS